MVLGRRGFSAADDDGTGPAAASADGPAATAADDSAGPAAASADGPAAASADDDGTGPAAASAGIAVDDDGAGPAATAAADNSATAAVAGRGRASRAGWIGQLLET
ncbi:hypothetical protein WME79_45055 [Sorangium sp. So ce726]|uniref:hypothetical protein n=1 Tax=Sorangium sp. So ce726 TaxID=3133319 RepID=UPI003F5D95B5